MNSKILVLGSTGKTGKRVVNRLQDLQTPVRLGSRKALPPFDWDEPGNWSDVLADIESVYITFHPDLAVPQAVEKIKLFTETASAGNVKKLVLLSGRGEKEAQVCERIVMNSGLNWTIVRASWFMQNFSESFLLDSVLSNEVVVPSVGSREPFVDADDIADVAVAALTDNRHSHQIYELTGPELLSFELVTSQIAKALNRNIHYSEVSIDEYVSILKSFHLPDDYISLIQYLFTEVLDGRNESVTHDIEKVLGRKPTSFKEYIDKTLETGVWSVPNSIEEAARH
ncbi:MAG TPA: NmrA family NAD(P)-binding protein [Bacteroidales bacterium]|nr:NmrA family NAD(P)-binding protein [Bacteroidales bacterium]